MPSSRSENASKEGIESEDDQRQHQGAEEHGASSEASRGDRSFGGKEDKEEEKVMCSFCALPATSMYVCTFGNGALCDSCRKCVKRTLVGG